MTLQSFTLQNHDAAFAFLFFCHLLSIIMAPIQSFTLQNHDALIEKKKNV